MTIYIPSHFTGDEADARRLIAGHPFATLITPAAGGAQVTHLPLLPDDSGTALLGHVARPNPHWQALEAADSVAVFHGPHAFVSRGWYVDPSDNVPTWNFATVHVTGRARLLPLEETRALLQRLERRFEPPGLTAMNPEKFGRLSQGVVGFSLPLARLEVKVKLSQNKSAADRAGVMAGLRADGGADALATVRWMQDREPG